MSGDRLAKIEVTLEVIKDKVLELDARIKPVETHVLMLNSFVKFSAGLSSLLGVIWVVINLWGKING